MAVIFHSHRERSSGADKRPRPTTTQTRPRLDPDVFKYSYLTEILYPVLSSHGARVQLKTRHNIVVCAIVSACD